VVCREKYASLRNLCGLGVFCGEFRRKAIHHGDDEDTEEGRVLYCDRPYGVKLTDGKEIFWEKFTSVV